MRSMPHAEVQEGKSESMHIAAILRSDSVDSRGQGKAMHLGDKFSVFAR